MKTSYVVAGVACLAVVAGIGWYLMQGSGAGLERSSGSLAALAARGGSWKCDVASESAGTTANGTVYVSGENIRGDFNATVPQTGAVEVHMIADGENVYVWTSMLPTGFKTTVAMSGESESAAGQDFYNQNYDYECSAWSSNPAQFKVPTDVTFRDLTSMSGGASVGGGMAAPDCSVCDQAGASKAQCLAALGCE